ncbi:hypothetical protein EB796_021894 [Bugula neritina]|uniref:Sperm microtubule inner protein 1 C-terminal domain-containing protein n=1 Tax=Bugula neritina TaxID=10212 RepID=A0A7J7J293_BUGNE|nr:hypothetical protein EB796_021894 [Bugula neritina]
MAPVNLISTQAQAFWTESIDKEETTRLSWHSKRKSGDSQSKQMEVFRKKIEMNAIKPNLDLVKGLPKVDNKRFARKSLKYVNDKIDKEAADRFASKSGLIVADMMPVDSRTRPLLYDGVTKEEKGRYQYLKIRHKVVPERKYQFPLLSSWEYGWKIGDVIKKDEIKKPDFGRTALIRDTFYTRNQIPQYPSFELMKSYTIA